MRARAAGRRRTFCSAPNARSRKWRSPSAISATHASHFGISARARQAGVDYVELVERGSFDRRVWPQLLRVVRDRGIDIVHSHDYKTDLLALLVGRSQGTIPLSTAHGWTGHSARERWLYYPLDNSCCGRSR